MRALVIDQASQPIRNRVRNNFNQNVSGFSPSSAGWGNPPASASRVASGGPDGRYFARATAVTNASNIGSGADLILFATSGWTVSGAGLGVTAPASPGVPVVLSCYVRCSRVQTVRIQAQMIKFSAGASGSANGPATILVPNTWTRLYVIATPAADATGVRIDIDTAGQTAWSIGDTFDFAMPMVVESSTDLGFYADGDSPGWQWTGAIGSSESAGYPL